MEVVVLDDADAVATFGARRVSRLVRKNPLAVIGLATGDTPIEMYQKLIELHCDRKTNLSFRHVKTFNLDEHVGADASYNFSNFMKSHLFDHIDIDLSNTHLPTCEEYDIPAEICANFEEAIATAGGIDLQILGIGTNGHIGFNEPTSSLSSRTRAKVLTQTTTNDNRKFIDKNSCQPHLAITMGIGTILDSRQILLIATGERKASSIRNTIEGPVSAMCPASALQLHEHVTIVLDMAAASMLKNVEYYQRVQLVKANPLGSRQK